MLRLSHFAMMLDFVIGAVFTAALLLLASQAYAIGGAPKEYEGRLVGNAFATVLKRVEASAHSLRAEYCNETQSPQQSQGAYCDPIESNSTAQS